MKLFTSAFALAAGTLAIATSRNGSAVAETPNVCFIVYQMADNNLEYFIREDNLEIIESCAVEKENFFTWIYFDGLNTEWWQLDENEPLESVWEKDGSALLSGDKYEGSQYLTYRHDLKKMVSNTKLQGEQNGDDPETVYDFLTVALENCVSKGASEFMLTLSSHGGGFHGFGGDEHPERERRRGRTARRDLTQSNADLAGAIRRALQDVDGAPDALDVLGFDACLMMSVSALAEYEDVAKYYLASEATEPGHGWAYKQMCDTKSAVQVATDIHENFLSQMQDFDEHLTPKTLALVDTAKASEFQRKLEAFARDLKAAIEADDDPDFYALLQHSRTSAVSFESVLDAPGTDAKTAMDVGSFFESFDDLCGPKTGTDLRASLDAVKVAYNDMYVVQGNGPGTPPATGMHVMWPKKKEYKVKANFFDSYVFNNRAVTAAVPDFFDMVQTFVLSSSPSTKSNAGTTCAKSAQSDVKPMWEGQLLLNPTISSEDGIVTVQSDIATSTDDVIVEYGINGTEWLFLPGRRRQRRDLKLSKVHYSGGTEHPVLAAGSMRSLLARRGLSSANRRAHQITRRDVEEGHLFVYGGGVYGTYSGSTFVANGARGFYFLKDSDNLTPIYLKTSPSGTAGQKYGEIPVMYFPEEADIKSEDLSYETTLEEALERGGRFGALTFGLDEEQTEQGATLTTGFALMTNADNSTDSTISETPPSAGGRIVPIMYVDGVADGVSYSEILGGVDQTVIEWNKDQEFDLLVMTPEESLMNFGLNRSSVLVDMYAFDYDKIDDWDNLEIGKGFDKHSFSVEIDVMTIDGSVAALRKPETWIMSLATMIGMYCL